MYGLDGFGRPRVYSVLEPSVSLPGDREVLTAEARQLISAEIFFFNFKAARAATALFILVN